MAIKIDLTGQTFGRLTVLRPDEETHGRNIKWICQCECGNTTSVLRRSLRSGATRSCGCLIRDSATTHGKTDTKEFNAWVSMKTRCLNKNSPPYPRYGGRGITICDRWVNSFENFLSDMGGSPSPKHTLDRINNDDGYYKENCRWVPMAVQNANRSSQVFITFNGETKHKSEWCRITGISFTTLTRRLMVMPVEDAMNKAIPLPKGTWKLTQSSKRR